MKKSFIIFFLFFLFSACDKQDKVKKAVEDAPVHLSVVRFDQAFFDSKPENLPTLKKKFPLFFPSQVPDSVWLEKMQNPAYRELYGAVQKKYGDFSSQIEDFESLFGYIKYYFPKFRVPKLIALVSEVDYNTRAIYADSIAIVSLEIYLGKSSKFYDFPKYIVQNCEERQMLPDMAESFALTQLSRPANDFLSKVIYWGKIHYLKQLFLPEYTAAEIIGYQPSQMKWSSDNEAYIWRYFINEQLLYKTDPKLEQRFLEPAPFSKFYLEIDNESPGRIGQFMGWQIVKSFMEKNDVSVSEMLKMDAKTLFEQSKYKPAKNAS